MLSRRPSAAGLRRFVDAEERREAASIGFTERLAPKADRRDQDAATRLLKAQFEAARARPA
jgi:hypothetical protein